MGEKLGDRIRRKRLDRGLGLREAARLAGISPSYLSRIETAGDRSPPAEKVLRAIAEVLGDDFDELMSAAGRVSEDVAAFITLSPGMPAFLREASARRMTAHELRALLEVL